jgi:hypothetical protein
MRETSRKHQGWPLHVLGRVICENELPRWTRAFCGHLLLESLCAKNNSRDVSARPCTIARTRHNNGITSWVSPEMSDIATETGSDVWPELKKLFHAARGERDIAVVLAATVTGAIATTVAATITVGIVIAFDIWLRRWRGAAVAITATVVLALSFLLAGDGDARIHCEILENALGKHDNIGQRIPYFEVCMGGSTRATITHIHRFPPNI